MTQGTNARLQHDALLYGSNEQLVTTMAPFLREGVALGHATVAVTSPDKLVLLRDALGADAPKVRYIEAADWYVRPAAVLAEYDAVVRELVDAGAPLVRCVAELAFGSTAAEHTSWTRYEAIVNRAFERLPMWVVCLYDTRALPGQLVDAARRTHPTLWEAGQRRPSARYLDPALLLREIPEPGLPVPGEASMRLRVDRDSNGWRHPVAAAIEGLGLAAGRAEEFLIAVGEVVANVMQHGDGTVRLTLWETGDAVVCEIRNDGRGVDDPFAGYLPPGSDGADEATGLWIARQLSDALAIDSGADGTSVRLAVTR